MTDGSATFVFADIAGFTALTEAHGDEAAIELIEAFSHAVDCELPRIGGEHVKTIGDALMLRVPDPGDAIHLGLWITHEAMRDHGSPAVRVGLHHGEAIARSGDYFGANVNLAARVSSAAAGGEVLVSGHTAALVPDLQGVIFESRGRKSLRNVSEPVELFAALRAGESRLDSFPIDPVCQMAVDPARAPGQLKYDDTVYFFCSITCVAAFATNPDRFLA
jgi:adenylate cyclase